MMGTHLESNAYSNHYVFKSLESIICLNFILQNSRISQHRNLLSCFHIWKYKFCELGEVEGKGWKVKI